MSASQIQTTMEKADLKVMKHLEEALESAVAQLDGSRMLRIHNQMHQLHSEMARREPLVDKEAEPEWHQQARDCGNVVEAIKLVRANTGWGLRESKDWVDTHCGRLMRERRDMTVETLQNRIDELEQELSFRWGWVRGDDEGCGCAS